MAEPPDLTVVVPMFNEGANVGPFFERLVPALERLNLAYEIVCVDDGSRDDTLARLAEYARRNPGVKVVALARNFGKEVALSAGIDHASGAAVVPIDADLQDPPELIEALVERWREGYEVVYATRRTRQGETWFKRFTANAFYRVLDRLTEVPIPRNTGDFRLIDRRVVDALKRLPERTRFMKGLFAWVGFRQAQVLYDREPRRAGRTTWSYWRLWNFALDGIAAFSSTPLKVWSYLGLAISLCAFVYAAFLIGRTLLYGADVPGYASLMVVILFLGGVQLVTLGVIGEYMGRIYTEVKGRPLYLVRERLGFEAEPETAPARTPRSRAAGGRSPLAGR